MSAPTRPGQGRGDHPAYQALAAAAANSAAWGWGRPFCVGGSGEAPGVGVGSGGPGPRGAHARVGGRKRSSEAWVRRAQMSGSRQLPALLSSSPPPDALPALRSSETIPAAPRHPATPTRQPRPRPAPGRRNGQTSTLMVAPPLAAGWASWRHLGFSIPTRPRSERTPPCTCQPFRENRCLQGPWG